MANINSALIDYINVEDRASDPTGTPASGYAFLYVKTDGLYIKLDDTTVVGPFSAGTATDQDAQVLAYIGF